jgi:quercetin dioxygenase-like cupin family protein
MKYTSGKARKLDVLFPKGSLVPAENFTGSAWAKTLLPTDTTYNTIVGNVYFEPGARSNWHSHPAGQILIITDGIGYHQIKGQRREILKKGDVVKCPPNTLHWHGASATVGMMQMYILPKTEKGLVKWLQKVTDQEYSDESNE